MECMPKIISSVSLQGCTSLFDDLDESEREKNPKKSSRRTTSTDSDVDCSTKAEEKKENDTHQKKRIKLTSLDSAVKNSKGPRPSFSNDPSNRENGRNSTLPECLLKTKEMFDTLLRICQSQDTSDNMVKVVDNLSLQYQKTCTEYLGSVQFQNLLEAETEKINMLDEKPWKNLNLVMKEMKHNRKTQLKSGEPEGSQDAQGSENEKPIIECPKKRQHLKILEKTLRALNKEILKYEQEEVDLSDDDSSYVKLDRYRARFTAVYEKICQIRGKLADAERIYLRKVSFAGSSCSTPSHIIRCIERYYNKHRQFPDFLDVRDLIIKANKQENIQMLPGKVHSIAETCFKEFGEMLKRLRQHDDYLIAASYLPDQSDPARDDPELQEKLHKNFLQRKKVEDVIDQFAKRQDGFVPDNDEKNEDKTENKSRLDSDQIPEDKKEDLSNNDSSDSRDDTDDTERNFINNNIILSSSSSGEESISKQQKAINKGKSLIGKKRLVKVGSKLQSTNKSLLPKVSSLSSDERSEPKNTKDNFTNYLGLKVTQITDGIDVKKNDVHDIEENNCKEVSINKNAKLSPLKSLFKSTSPNSEPELTHNDVPKNLNDNLDDSDSSARFIKDSVNVIEDSESCKKENIRQKSKIAKNLSLYSSSEQSEESSDDENNKVFKSGEISDIDLSEDSGEKEETKKPEQEELDGDEPVVILSEEVPVPIEKSLGKISPAQRQRSEGSSESDDIVILSQDSDISIGPVNRAFQPTFKPKPKICSVSNLERKRTHPTPGQSNKPQMHIHTMLVVFFHNIMKRMVSHECSSRIFKKQKRIVDVGNCNRSMGNNQLTLPRLVNGTARKTFRNAPPPVPKVVDIPVIELD